MGRPSLDRYIRRMLGEGTWAYKPLRAVLPRPVAAWLTFLVSGFVPHDMIGWTLGRRVQAPVMTIMFALLGGVAVAADIAHMDISRAPFVVRLAANVSYSADAS